jgi:hypothetical protein
MLKKIIKWTLIWMVAFLVTATAAVYQRMTGPTYPKKVELKNGEAVYKLKLIRSHEGKTECPVQFIIPDTAINAEVSYRRYPVNEAWTTKKLERLGDTLVTSLPSQPAAGKIEYKIAFYSNGILINQPGEFHTIVRFKDAVPLWVLIPHIFLIFLAMLLSNITGYLAVVKAPATKIYLWLTFIIMLVGGMLFGPILQYYAFGDLWTGIPFGWDLTDNKTLIAFAAWVLALIMNRKKPRYGWIIAAAIITIVIFSIPHSMFGSEFNYATGEVIQG